jgi:GTP-binding protein
MGFIVALVGAPNVGKSTLFNRLIKRKKAVVDDQPGVTRDRNYQELSWEGKTLTLVDTGGFEWDHHSPLGEGMQEQIEVALDEADLIVFVGDGKIGLTPTDQMVMERLRRTTKPIIYTVNKIDHAGREDILGEFYRLGIESLLPVSALHGLGMGELEEEIARHIPRTEEVAPSEEVLSLTVIGRPNVGKSSLVNALLGEDRVMVSPVPGTTRDAIDTPFEFQGQKYLLIDTAGIRRKARISLRLEKYCVLEAIKTLDRCDLAVILLDAQDQVTDQDARIAGLAFEKGRACLVGINKWDLIAPTVKKKAYLEELRYQLKYLAFAPFIPVSAQTGYGLGHLMKTARKVYLQYTQRVGTGQVNQALKKILAGHSLPLMGGQRVKIFYGTQVGVKPPTFVFFANYPEKIHFSYQRYLVNQLREQFRMDSTPIRVYFRKREKEQ